MKIRAGYRDLLSLGIEDIERWRIGHPIGHQHALRRKHEQGARVPINEIGLMIGKVVVVEVNLIGLHLPQGGHCILDGQSVTTHLCRRNRFSA